LIIVSFGLPPAVLILGLSYGYRTAFGEAAARVPFAERMLVSALIYAVLIAATLLCRRLFRIGAALRQPNAVELLEADSRPPVLYLRSFDDDAAPDMTESVIPFAPVETIETRLSQVFRPIGPVVSIGRPGERLPEIGASRLYVSDDVWQQAVIHFLQRAVAVVILVGRSTGVTWEIETTLLTVPRERILFVFPFLLPREKRTRWRIKESTRPRGRGDDSVSEAALAELRREHDARYASFRERFGSLLTSGLPISLQGSVFLDFLPDGLPRVLPRRQPLFIRRRRDRQGITLDYDRALRPFVAKLQGHPIPPDPAERFFSNPFTVGALTAVSAIAALVLFMSPFWAGFTPLGVALFFSMLVPANVAYWGVWNLAKQASSLRADRRIAAGGNGRPTSSVVAALAQRMIGATAAGWLGAVFGALAYSAGKAPQSADELWDVFAVAFIDAIGGAIAGTIAGLRRGPWSSMTVVTATGVAAIVVLAVVLASMPFDSPHSLDVGDLLVLAFPIFAIGGATLGTSRARRARSLRGEAPL
jgi:hypothetical protein